MLNSYIISWALANREQLEDKNSSLEFKLHRLHFIDLIKQGPEKQVETLNYAKQFARFAYQHTRGNYIQSNLNGSTSLGPWKFVRDMGSLSH